MNNNNNGGGGGMGSLVGSPNPNQLMYGNQGDNGGNGGGSRRGSMESNGGMSFNNGMGNNMGGMNNMSSNPMGNNMGGMGNSFQMNQGMNNMGGMSMGNNSMGGNMNTNQGMGGGGNFQGNMNQGMGGGGGGMPMNQLQNQGSAGYHNINMHTNPSPSLSNQGVNTNFQMMQNNSMNMNGLGGNNPGNAMCSPNNQGLNAMMGGGGGANIMNSPVGQQFQGNDVRTSSGNTNMSNNSNSADTAVFDDSNNNNQGQQVLLCASCDRCRARKTKCDGGRPCTNCANRYKKQNKVSSIEGVDSSQFDCVYSPAKRRGPIPGKSGQVRKANDMHSVNNSGNQGSGAGNSNGGFGQNNMGAGGGFGTGQGMNSNLNSSPEELKQMLVLQQQLLLQQQQMQEQQRQQGVIQQLATMVGANIDGSGIGSMNNSNQQFQNQRVDNGSFSTPFQVPSSQQPPMMSQQQFDQQNQRNDQYPFEDRSSKRTYRLEGTKNKPSSVNTHLPLLNLNHPDGTLLRSYYELSVNDVLNLPPIPTDEEYCARLARQNIFCDPNNLPVYDQSALQAARFAELALGALANNQAPLALELSNASVMCLRNCVDHPSHIICLYDVARAYLLHGIFRSYRGDVVRYFKYRRVCMSHVSQLKGVEYVDALVAAISFHDSWAYMIHNASEDALPDIDDVLPRPSGSGGKSCSDAVDIAGDPLNQNWIQGAPSIFLNNEAPAINRSLDALACAVRSCCDHANQQFEEMAKEAGVDMPGDNSGGVSATSMAVMARENELCSRNIVSSAQSLLNQHTGMSAEKVEKHGLRLLVLSMEAFLDGGDDDSGGFTDKQIKNLLKVCDIIVKNPQLLYAPGPLYHMVSNVAIMLCHLLNGMHANCSATAGSSTSENDNGGMEGVLFDEVVDSFMAVRKLLNIHRKCLPVRLRCHGVPRPNIGPFKKAPSSPEAPFIDLGETLMCASRGCQGFVLMGCSPCVAAERAMSAAKDHATDEDNNEDEDEFQRELGQLGDDFNLDDDTLFNVLSRIVQN